jgi:hypothetical protein
MVIYWPNNVATEYQKIKSVSFERRGFDSSRKLCVSERLHGTKLLKSSISARFEVQLCKCDWDPRSWFNYPKFPIQGGAFEDGSQDLVLVHTSENQRSPLDKEEGFFVKPTVLEFKIFSLGWQLLTRPDGLIWPDLNLIWHDMTRI